MHIILALFFFGTFNTYHCEDIKEIFEKVNQEFEKFKAIEAEIAWESTIDPGNTNLVHNAAIYKKEKIEWQQKRCNELKRLQDRHLFNSSQGREKYLLCRGPKYTYEEARFTSELYGNLQSIYNEAKICIPSENGISPTNLTEVEKTISNYLKSANNYFKKVYRWQDPMFAVKTAIRENENGVCLEGEDAFQNLMAFSRDEEVLKWAWLVWREKVGPPMKEVYRKFVQVENVAARRNGYRDIGASWREEQEMPNLRQKCRRLYDDIKPLYALLHGVARFFLRKEYGDVVPEFGPIPAHLLGNLWSQNWESIADLIVPQAIDLDESIVKQNWTVEHMIRRVEDFYQSLGLPPMSESFWTKSLFSRPNNKTRCHGAAADMFKEGDYRLIYCSGSTKEDFYVLHHELGHIQYFMAYQHQPGLFRQANTAFHEAIGDTIMYGVLTPQHLYRLGLINDSLLYNNHAINIKDNKVDFNPKNIPTNIDHNKNHNNDLNENQMVISTDEILLLKQALNKIPQIPFSLVIDEYRFDYFEDLSHDMNKRFWELTLELQGIAPPLKRGANEFDAAAKFHVPDNTPYIRYFLSSFLQHQIFESLCKGAVFGRRGVKDPLPVTITMNRCDIYGSKTAGKILMDIMSRGHSQHWQRILQETIGQSNISASALERHYRPLYVVLEKLVRLYRIPIGW